MSYRTPAIASIPSGWGQRWGAVAFWLITQSACSPEVRRVRDVSTTCLANLAGIEDGTSSTVAHEARSLCEILGSASRPKDHSRPLSTQLIKEILRERPRARAQVLFYAGHGTWSEVAGKRGVEFASADPSDHELSAALLLRLLDSAPAAWSVLMLNTCDSGWVDLRGTKKPIVAIGAGYGRVSQANAPHLPYTEFGSALIRAIKGEADTAPFGNGDCVVTDREARRYLNAELRRAARSNQLAWALRPLAVVKTTAAYPLPIAWRKGPTCITPNFLSLPLAVGDRAREYRKFMEGGPPPKAASRRVLFVSDPAPWPKFNDSLKAGLHPLGWDVFPIREAQIQAARKAAMSVDFPEIYELAAQPSTSSEFHLELTDLQNRNILWSASIKGEPGALDAGRLVAPHLPTSLDLVNLSSSSNPDWVLVVHGPLPKRVQLLRWQAYFNKEKPSQAKIELELLPSLPCPRGRGQCFRIEPPGPNEEIDEWFVRQL